MFRRVTRGLACLLIACCAVYGIAGDEAVTTVFQAETVNIHCAALGKDVGVEILVPASYDWDDEVYTSIYVVDSRPNEQYMGTVSGFIGEHEDVLPVVIVRIPVSLVKDTPVEVWVEFMKASVFPVVEAKYRVRPFRVLAGDQMGPRDALVIGTDYQGIFHGVIALDSSDQPLQDQQIEEAIESFAGQTSQRLSLFMIAKDDSAHMAPFTLMEKELECEKAMRVRLVVYNAKNANKEGKFDALLRKGLTFCYADWFLVGDLRNAGIKGIEGHYQDLSRLTGVELTPPERILDRLAYNYQMSGQHGLAIEALKYNARLHPRAAEAYAAIGQGWLAHKRFRVAVLRFKQAVSIAEETNNPQLARYQAMLKDAYEQIDYMQGVGLTEGGVLQKITGGLP